MEITQACVNIALFLQKYFRFPIRLCPFTMESKVDKLFFTSVKYNARIFWCAGKYMVFVLTAISLLRIARLFHHPQESDMIVQMGFCILFGSLGIMALLMYDLVERETSEISFLQTNILKLSSIRIVTRTSRRKPKFREVTIYVATLTAALIFACLSVFIPFLVNFDHVKFILVWVCPQAAAFQEYFTVKFLASYIYFLVTFCVGTDMLYFMTIGLSFSETISTASNKLLDKVKHYKISNLYGSACNQNCGKIVFVDCLKRYWAIEILLRSGCQVGHRFLQALVIMGITMTTTSCCVMLKFYSKLPLAVYVTMSCTFPLFICVIIVLAELGATPAESGWKLRQLWKERLVREIDMMWLRSCIPIGYTLGYIQTWRKKTVLKIFDVILNATATMVLMKF